MNIWLQAALFIIGAPVAFVLAFLWGVEHSDSIMLLIAPLVPIVLTLFGFFVLPILLDKYRRFRLNTIIFDYIDIKKIQPSMQLPKIRDIELAYYIGGHVWIVQDSRIIVQTYILKWIQDDYLEQVPNIENEKGIKLIIKKDIVTDSILEKELFNMVKEMTDSENAITKYSMDEWMIKNRLKMRNWFKLLYNSCFEKATATSNFKYNTTNANLYRYKNLSMSKANNRMVEYAKQLMALKKYLSEYSTMEQREPVEVHLWNEYMLYASLFGITDRVENRLKNMCPENINYDRQRNGLDPLREIGLAVKKAKVNIRKILKENKKQIYKEKKPIQEDLNQVVLDEFKKIK